MHHFIYYDALMSTNKPRITITLEPVTSLQLRRISELTGNSQSSMVSEVLEQAAPVFDRLIKVLEAADIAQKSAEAAKKSVRLQSVGQLDLAQQRIEQQMGLVLDDFDNATAPLLEELEKVSRRHRAGGQAVRRTHADAASAPLSNRGVRSLTKPKKTTAKKAV